MKKIIYVLALTLLLVACGNDEAKDQTNKAKATPGEITHEPLKINLAVRSEGAVEQFNDITDIKVNEDDITAEKLDVQTAEDGTEYDNVYYVKGKYSWQSKKYDFEWMISFKENDTSKAGTNLKFVSSQPNSKAYEIELK